MLQAVFFDFDGVIADSEPLHLRAYQSVLQRDDIDLTRDEYYQRYLGYDDVGLFQALAKDRGLTIDTARIDDWIEAKAEIVEELLAGDGILFPGAANCVKLCAARVPLAVASGALEPEIELVLDHAGLRDYFRGDCIGVRWRARKAGARSVSACDRQAPRGGRRGARLLRGD